MWFSVNTVVRPGAPVDVDTVNIYEVWFKSLLKQELASHIATMHNNVCVICKYEGDSKDILTLHMKSHEPKTKSFKCTECDYECTSQDLLNTHIGSHKGNAAAW